MIFIPAFQFTSTEVGKNSDQSKKVKEVEPKDDRARVSDGRKENDAGKTSCSCVFNLVCDVFSMPRIKRKGKLVIFTIYYYSYEDWSAYIKMPYLLYGGECFTGN